MYFLTAHLLDQMQAYTNLAAGGFGELSLSPWLPQSFWNELGVPEKTTRQESLLRLLGVYTEHTLVTRIEKVAAVLEV